MGETNPLNKFHIRLFLKPSFKNKFPKNRKSNFGHTILGDYPILIKYRKLSILEINEI